MEKWFNKKIEEIAKILNTNLKVGLSEDEVQTRQNKYGFNELKAEKKKFLQGSIK